MSNVTKYNLSTFYNGIMRGENPLYKYQFIAEFIGDGLDKYGINDSSDAAHNVSYYVQSANIPGIELTTAKTTYLGTEFRLPGVAKYAHNWTCNILLEQNLLMYKGFRKWQEEISSLTKDGGGNKAIPNVQVRLSILNSDGLSKEQAIILEGVWCKSVGDISVKYAQGGGDPIKSFPIELRFQYNYMDNPGEFDMSTDPYNANNK